MNKSKTEGKGTSLFTQDTVRKQQKADRKLFKKLAKINPFAFDKDGKPIVQELRLPVFKRGFPHD